MLRNKLFLPLLIEDIRLFYLRLYSFYTFFNLRGEFYFQSVQDLLNQKPKQMENLTGNLVIKKTIVKSKLRISEL